MRRRNGALASQMFTICQTGVVADELRFEIDTGCGTPGLAVSWMTRSSSSRRTSSSASVKTLEDFRKPCALNRSTWADVSIARYSCIFHRTVRWSLPKLRPSHGQEHGSRDEND